MVQSVRNDGSKSLLSISGKSFRYPIHHTLGLNYHGSKLMVHLFQWANLVVAIGWILYQKGLQLLTNGHCYPIHQTRQQLRSWMEVDDKIPPKGKEQNKMIRVRFLWFETFFTLPLLSTLHSLAQVVLPWFQVQCLYSSIDSVIRVLQK